MRSPVFAPPEPPFRTLRGFALDPSLAGRLETAPISEIVFKIPWESLAPGPVGQYLEVVDVDPASGTFYEPIRLDEPKLLAQSGLAPSEGTPQFHQQMTYAVASLTIANFEYALGRRTLWRAGPAPKGKHPKNDSVFVPRLRVYPHALREANAYYSPDKIALLFGYFNAVEEADSAYLAGGMVFTCLSHDIVAHETTHAIVDGMHPRFLRPTHPDVRAFHEAFADIVALFQHFTFPEILRHQIASARGEIRSQPTLLGRLASEFGLTTGLRGALRDAIGHVDPQTRVWRPTEPTPQDYDRSLEPHARGAVLVAAIFDAFLSIYERRTSDLLRLATGGTGVLQPGAIHPDLVRRLAEEAAKAAQHVLTMCIRALDYCPPVDLTFGEFLRAVITADADLVRDDDLHYRIAFVEAFRKRGIYPRDVRTLSVESLLWRKPENDEARPSPRLNACFSAIQAHAQSYLFAEATEDDPRQRLFEIQRAARRDLHTWLKRHFRTTVGRDDAKYLGLDAARSFEVHSVRFTNRVSPDGNVDMQMLATVLQERQVPADAADPRGPTMTFEGGATIVADLRRRQFRYCIRKSVTSARRLARQQEFAISRRESLRATYFGEDTEGTKEPFAALHRGI
jgi:hypothetical protein